MRALRATGDPRAVVRVVDVDPPHPAPHEALVRQVASSLNRGEVASLPGTGLDQPLGWDVAGVVVAAATDGSGPAAGSRVVGVVDGGAWAEVVAVPTARLAPIPDTVDFASASTLPLAGLTAWRALTMRGSLLGRRVLVTGAAGGVGGLAVQLAARGGAHVTAVVSAPERGDALRALGAHHVAVGLDGLPAQYFDLVLESVAGESLSRCAELLAPDGVLVTYGRSSGRDYMLPADWFMTHPFASLRTLNVFAELDAGHVGADELARLVQMLADGLLKSSVATTGALTEADELMRSLMQRRIVGKAVLTV